MRGRADRAGGVGRWAAGGRNRGLLLTLLVLGLAAPAAADIVHLKNGQRIEGRAVEVGDAVRIELDIGSLTFDRADVLRIERQPLLADEYDRRLREMSPGDATAARKLARWCERSGLSEEAAALRDRALTIEIDRRLGTIDRRDADDLFRVAVWARDRGYPASTQRQLLEMVVAEDPEHLAARALLGHRRFRGGWAASATIERILAEEHAEKMRSEGYVRCDGRWMTPAEAALERERAALAETRASLERELASVRGERERLAELDAHLREQLEAIERQRREVAALRAELESQRRELERAVAEARRSYGHRYGTVVVTPRYLRARARQPELPQPPAPKAAPTRIGKQRTGTWHGRLPRHRDR